LVNAPLAFFPKLPQPSTLVAILHFGLRINRNSFLSHKIPKPLSSNTPAMPQRKRASRASQRRTTRTTATSRKPKLIPPIAISDDEQSDNELVQPDIEVPLRERRVSRSRSTDDVTNGKAKEVPVKDDVLNPEPEAEDEEEDEDDEDGDEEV
jgi:hypothetical protein